MMPELTKDNLFKPQPALSASQRLRVNHPAWKILDDEKSAVKLKTDRLRAARVARDDLGGR
ncbi:hypothetical protein [Brucella sp. NBRC 12950]|uniref:hypothetical protein n=1 Tax=Brucella sp. NBRC 12950 TaxID=2994518 RepID=UPI00249FEFDF|nr:hypothetical protein [Brucella sp. NBRC 12950]GLU27494.1 hypothetical protein Brsp01_27270 [Brucella sp. NBRC 12950]